MGRFDFYPTPIQGLLVLQGRRIEDARGYLSRLYCVEEFTSAGLPKAIRQINHTLTKRKGAVRGLHFQTGEHMETKVVTCLRGEIFDVAVDLRRASPTFLHWHAEVLSPGNQKALVIPEGFAHGFQTLTEDCELIYFHTQVYAPNAEGGLHVQDPRLGIRWPLEITELSERDSRHPLTDAQFGGLDA